MEELEDKIAEEQERKQAAEERLQSRNKLLVGIREGLDRLTEKLVSAPHGSPMSKHKNDNFSPEI